MAQRLAGFIRLLLVMPVVFLLWLVFALVVWDVLS